MKDRQPTQPGRVKLTPENGTAPFYAVMEMADEPTEVGTPPTKANLLQDETEHALFGNIADRTVNDAFANIAKELSVLHLKVDDVAALSVTLKSAQGNPLANVQIIGMFDESGSTCVTNASGVASGYVAKGNVTLSVSNYADIVDYSETFIAEAGKSYIKTITVTTRNFLKITSSKNLKFSQNVSRVDVTAVGGGGAGATGNLNSSGWGDRTQLVYGVPGGGGGYCTVKENVDFVPDKSYSATVGAGGAVSSTNFTSGKNGGSSSFLGVTANGGQGGQYTGTDTDDTHTGGAGNGKGGDGVGTPNRSYSANSGQAGVNGSVMGYSSFTETVRYGGGGGSGCVCGTSSNVGGSGGSGYGGKGGSGWSGAGSAGTDGFGGGGGGGASWHDEVNPDNGFWVMPAAASGRGGSGCIAIRMHLKSA